MDKPRQGDIRQAFLTALNESEERYLLVGDMAWSKHREGIRESKVAEAWIDPSAPVESVLSIYARTYGIVRQEYPETNRDEFMARMGDEVKIHREQYPLNFETSYENRVPSKWLGQPTFFLSGDHLVARESQSPEEHKREQANELLRQIRAKEFERSQKPERGPDNDPGPKPTPPEKRRDRDRSHDRD